MYKYVYIDNFITRFNHCAFLIHYTESTLNSSSVNDTHYNESSTNASLNAIYIPSRTFENITDNRIGVVFSFYADNALFPIRLNQTVSENTTYKAIGSAVLSATLAGQEIRGLIEPINITLSITLTVSFPKL